MAKQLFAVYEEPENIDSKVAWQNFIEAVTSEETRYKYGYSFMTYLEFLKIRKDDLHILLKQNPKVIEANIISYIRKMRDERLAYSTMNVKLSAIVLFFTMNDIIVNRKKIGKFLGEHTKKVKDRAYTREEIKKIVDASDRKYKVFVLLMASTGCRLGAIPPLKLKHLKYFEDYKLYQITFYEGTKYEYYSFCTPECTKYIDEYLDYRKRCGEKLNENSPLLRDDFILDDSIAYTASKTFKQ